PPTTYAELNVDPLATWIEDTFGVTECDGVLVRAFPTTVPAASEALSGFTGHDIKTCTDAIRRTLLAGTSDDAVNPDNGQRLFAFKLHQFISRGDTVYQTLAVGDDRWFTTQKQVYQPGNPSKL